MVGCCLEFGWTGCLFLIVVGSFVVVCRVFTDWLLVVVVVFGLHAVGLRVVLTRCLRLVVLFGVV